MQGRLVHDRAVGSDGMSRDERCHWFWLHRKVALFVHSKQEQAVSRSQQAAPSCGLREQVKACPAGCCRSPKAWRNQSLTYDRVAVGTHSCHVHISSREALCVDERAVQADAGALQPGAALRDLGLHSAPLRHQPLQLRFQTVGVHACRDRRERDRRERVAFQVAAASSAWSETVRHPCAWKRRAMPRAVMQSLVSPAQSAQLEKLVLVSLPYQCRSHPTYAVR